MIAGNAGVSNRYVPAFSTGTAAIAQEGCLVELPLSRLARVVVPKGFAEAGPRGAEAAHGGSVTRCRVTKNRRPFSPTLQRQGNGGTSGVPPSVFVCLLGFRSPGSVRRQVAVKQH